MVLTEEMREDMMEENMMLKEDMMVVEHMMVEEDMMLEMEMLEKLESWLDHSPATHLVNFLLPQSQT